VVNRDVWLSWRSFLNRFAVRGPHPAVDKQTSANGRPGTQAIAGDESAPIEHTPCWVQTALSPTRTQPVSDGAAGRLLCESRESDHHARSTMSISAQNRLTACL
jgi:hypothetical protein